MTLTADITTRPGIRELPNLDGAARDALFTSARTANTFAETPVTDAELEAIWELAKWPPTAANLQPLRVLFVRPGEGRDRLVEQMNEGNKAKTASAPAVAVLAYDTRFHEHASTVFPFRPELAGALENNETHRFGMAENNAWLQAGYFILAVRAQGLAAGPMGGFDADGIDREFFDDGRFRSFLVVNIGHPGEDAWQDRLPRLDNDTAVSWA